MQIWILTTALWIIIFWLFGEVKKHRKARKELEKALKIVDDCLKSSKSYFYRYFDEEGNEKTVCVLYTDSKEESEEDTKNV